MKAIMHVLTSLALATVSGLAVARGLSGQSSTGLQIRI
jgi:hypothetical protein